MIKSLCKTALEASVVASGALLGYLVCSTVWDNGFGEKVEKVSNKLFKHSEESK